LDRDSRNRDESNEMRARGVSKNEQASIPKAP
jgi:hypothetical protein